MLPVAYLDKDPGLIEGGDKVDFATTAVPVLGNDNKAATLQKRRGLLFAIETALAGA